VWWRWLVLVLVMAACTTSSTGGPSPSTAAPEPASTPRLVSLSPALTETLGALGAADQLVARSTFCTRPASVSELPAVGTALTPDLERIATLKPTAVLVDGSQGVPRESLSQVASVRTLPWLTTQQVLASVRELGELTDTSDKAAALARRLESGLTPTATPDAPRTLLVLGTEGPAGTVWFIKPDSLHGTALLAAGGRNAVSDPVAGAPSLSAEQVVKLDPDRVVLLESRALTPAQEQAAVARWTALTPLTAVREQQVHVLAEPDLLSTGPGILHFVEALSPVVSP